MENTMARNGNAKTRRFALNMLKAGVAITGAALLFACGDDDSSFVASENGGSAAEADIVVTIFDDLPNCTGKREGVTAYVKDEKTAYVCSDGDWVVVGESGDEGDDDDDDGDDADKKSSSSKAKSADSKGKSSSSEGVGSASSSSSSRDLFEMSKDEFLNPKISYGEMTDSRDNQVYKTVEICNNKTSTCQTWMAENLNYSVNPNVQSWCGGGRDYTEGDCSVYGRLYTWAAAIDSVALANDAGNPQTCGYDKICTLPTVVQGVCPEGWHLPSYDEWQTLRTAVGGEDKAGTALKSQIGWYSQTGDAADRDAYGFSALPAGLRYGDGVFYAAGDYADFWSASQVEVYSDYAYRMYLDYYFEDAYLGFNYKINAFSVRCLQN